MVGKELTKHLLAKGNEVALLSRNPNKVKDVPAFYWNPLKNEIDENCISDVDYIINLAGAGIADKRWTVQRKKLIMESRTSGAEILANLLKDCKRKIKYIAASAIGYYGDRGQEVLDVESTPGTGFLSESVLAWESASRSITTSGANVYILRIGIVLSTKGGALAKMLPSYSFKLGSYFGNGSQIYSWVHIVDLVRIFGFLMEQSQESANGMVFNAVAPHPVSNKQLAHTINTAGKFGAIVVSAPTFALKFALGEMAAVVLDSTNVKGHKLEGLGFKFRWPTIDSALVDILENGK